MLIEKKGAEIYVKYCHFNLDIHWFEAYKKKKMDPWEHYIPEKKKCTERMNA